MNTKKLKKLADDLRNVEYEILKRGAYFVIYYKSVKIAEVPDEGLANHIAQDYGALNERMANSIDTLIDHIEANVKQGLLNLNFTGEKNVTQRPSTDAVGGHSTGIVLEGVSGGANQSPDSVCGV